MMRSSSRVPPVRAAPDCATCDHNYRGTFRALCPDVDRLAVYDIDLVLEHGGRIFGIVEWKKTRQEYEQYLVPAFEYVGLKKFAKLLRVVPYVIYEIVGADAFWIFPVDRFEKTRPFTSLPSSTGKYAVFLPAEGRRCGRRDFSLWLQSEIDRAERDPAMMKKKGGSA